MFIDSGEINPQNILASAIRKVPAVRYALGVAGVAAAVALILGLIRDIRIAFFGIAFTLALMVVLLIFSHMVEDLPGKKWMAAFLAWIVITLFSAMLVSTFTSFMFGFPQKFALFLQTNKESSATAPMQSATAREGQQKIIGTMEDLPEAEVAKLKPDSSDPSTDEKQRQIEWSIHNDSSWIVEELVVKLRIKDTVHYDVVDERYYRLRLSSGSSGEPYKTSEYIGEYVFPAQYIGNYLYYSIESAKGVKQ